MTPIVLSNRIDSVDVARCHVQSFPCPEGFSGFAWKELQRTALSVWHAHLQGTQYSGNLHFCREEFYDMLLHPDGHSIIAPGRIRRYKAA